MLQQAYDLMFNIALIILGILAFFCLIRAIRGPEVTDRIFAINMISTMTVVIIGVLTIMLEEGYLADVAIIYAMISFLAVVILCKVYMGVHLEKQEKKLKNKTIIEHHDSKNKEA